MLYYLHPKLYLINLIKMRFFMKILIIKLNLLFRQLFILLNHQFLHTILKFKMIPNFLPLLYISLIHCN